MVGDTSIDPSWSVPQRSNWNVERGYGVWRCLEVGFPIPPFLLVELLLVAGLVNIMQKIALAPHTSVFWPYSRKENLFRIKNYLINLSRLS